MPHSFTPDGEDRLKRRATTYTVADLKLTQTFGDTGYWYVLLFPADVAYEENTYRHFLVSGRIIDEAGHLPEATAGWQSSNETQLITAGRYKRVMTEPSELWCVRSTNPDADIKHLGISHLQAGETVQAAQGQVLFIASGSAACDGKSLVALKEYRLTANKTITASAETWALIWTPRT